MMVSAKTTLQIDIEPEEAFRILCESLYMNFVLNEKTDFFVKESYQGNNAVYYRYKDDNGRERIQHFDERGDLFVALRNVAVNIFPNTSFRNAEYIYNK